MIEAVIPYLKAGLCVLPAKDKQPFIQKQHNPFAWKAYQSVKPSYSLFEGINIEQMSLVCGGVSDNLELIDVDNTWDKTSSVFKELKAVVDTFDLPVCINRTKRIGFHFIYRCEEIEGNQKLAQFRNEDGKLETAIETRGEGGQAIIPPTPGYETIYGSMLNIGYISPEHRRILFETARTFGVPEEKKVIHYQSDGNGIMAKFNSLPNVFDMARDVLTEYGWKFVGKKGVIRPDKKEFGYSATWGYTPAPNVFYVWSSNAYPFESQRAYSPYQIICLLHFKGNWREMRQYAEKMI